MAAKTARKLDLKKAPYKHLYAPSADAVTLVDVPPLQFVMVDGAGDPNTAQAYRDAISALYSLSYTLKFASKNELGIDYTVMPLEGLWWTEDMAEFSAERKDQWLWTAMILQPEHITPELFAAAVEKARRGKEPSPLLDQARLETFHEGISAQILHIGPYAAEAPTIARLHAWIRANGYEFHGAGKHHEIYLSDPGRTDPARLKTIVRQPVIRPVQPGGER